MNFLFGALLIVLILLPGPIFRFWYLAVPYKKTNPTTSFLESVLGFIFISFILQFLSYLLVNSLIKDINEEKLYLFLINSDKAVEKFHLTANEIGLSFLYFLSVYVIASVLGFGCRKLVLRKKWDLKFPVLKIYSDWYDYFEGRILDYPDQPGESGIILEKWIDILVENKSESYIYTGMLREYVLSHDEKLERIYLTGVMRRKLSDDKDAQKGKRSVYYYMPGDFFLIPGDQIVNLNLTYFETKRI